MEKVDFRVDHWPVVMMARKDEMARPVKWATSQSEHWCRASKSFAVSEIVNTFSGATQILNSQESRRYPKYIAA